MWSSIKLIIQQAMDLFIPKVKLRSHQFPKWFTPDIRHRLNCLRTLRRKCITHPTAHNLSKLLLLESNLDADISSAKLRYETDLIFKFTNSNCNKIFKYIRGISGHSSIPLSVELCSAFATSDLDKASLFNKYFYFIFTLSSFELPPLDSLPTLSSTLSDISRALASPRFRVSDPQISARSSKNQAQGVQWTPAFLWRNARRR